MDHLLDASGAERRDACERRLDVLLEMVVVVVEELELEFLGHHSNVPGDRIRLVADEDEAADLLLEIGAPIRITDRGKTRFDAGNLFGDDILMPDRLLRHADAAERADLA